jgi:hypothetical protein
MERLIIVLFTTIQKSDIHSRSLMRTLTIIILSCLLSTLAAGQKAKTENIVLITLDGMRWQEVFKGADSALMKQQQFLKDAMIREKYWRDDVGERRKALFPFFWNTIALHGQLLGNRTAGSNMNVTNNQWFSYPGYNEILTGSADNERIHSNDKFYNPNTTILEFIHEKKGFSKKVAAFTSWDVFPYIINDKRNGIVVNAGLTPAQGANISEQERTMNKLLKALPNPLGDVRLDAFTFYYGMEYMKKNLPKVMYFAFDETDDFAHAGEYGAYLNSAHQTDALVGELWNYLQSDDFYKNKTTLILTCDHGRGAGSQDWRHHGIDVPGADQVWMAVIGPDTATKGESTPGQYYQNQIAKTIAELLGLTYKNDRPVGESIQAVIGR